MTLRLAYSVLALGLMSFGGLLAWLGLRRPRRPTGVPLRAVLALTALTALAGAVAAAILEARAAQPW